MSIKLFYLLVFVTPFIFLPCTNELFEFPKMHFVYLLGSLLFALTLLPNLHKPSHGHVIRVGSLLPVMLVIGFIISTAFSSHTYTSLWGYYSRFNGGLVSVLIFFGIYLSVRSLHPSTRTVLKAVSLTLIPISAYSVMQHFGISRGWESGTTVRAFSTFGQPNWLAAYCAMVLPIPLFLSLENTGRKKDLWGWLVLFVLGYCGLWFSYSLSGLLGSSASFMTLLWLNRKEVIKNLLPLGLTFVMCLIIMLLNPGIFRSRINDALIGLKKPQEVPVAIETAGVPSGVYNVSDSGFIRRGIWEGTVRLWASSPKNILVGSGPETFPYAFQDFRPASLNYSSEWNYILNKPHNYYLELLSQNGVVGLLTYLMIIAWAIYRRNRVITPALMGLFVTNIFGWPTVSTSLLFWVFLALLFTDDEKSKGFSLPSTRLSKTATLILPAVLVALCLLVNAVFIKQYLADASSNQAERYFNKGEIQKALWLSNRSISLNPHEPYYYRQRAKIRIPGTIGKTGEEAMQSKSLILGDLLKSAELNPKNAATLRGQVPLYYFLAPRDFNYMTASQPQQAELDPLYATLAKNYYTDLARNYPSDAGVLVLVAKYQKMLGELSDYENTVNRIKILRPDLLEWYLK